MGDFFFCHWVRGIWYITEARIGVNLKILSVTVSSGHCANISVSYTRGNRFENRIYKNTSKKKSKKTSVTRKLNCISVKFNCIASKLTPGNWKDLSCERNFVCKPCNLNFKNCKIHSFVRGCFHDNNITQVKISICIFTSGLRVWDSALVRGGC